MTSLTTLLPLSSNTPANTPAVPVTSVEVEMIVALGGNMHLAAEKLGVPVEELIARVAQDDEALGRSVKAATLVLALDVVQELAVALKASMSEMDPRDLGRTFTALLASIPALATKPAAASDSHDQHLTINQFNPETARGKLLDNILRAASGGSDFPDAGPAEGPVVPTEAIEGTASPATGPSNSKPSAGDSAGADVRLGVLGSDGPAGAEPAVARVDAADGPRLRQDENWSGDSTQVQERRAS